MRIKVTDLKPGTNYFFELQGKNDDEVSEWSRKFPVTTITYNGVPNTPVLSSWVVSGDTFHGEWPAVTTNTDGKVIPIVRYEIELTANSVSKYVSVVPQSTSGANVTYDLSFENNRALFGTPRPIVAIKVRAVDNINNKSDWSLGLSATNQPPAAPATITGTAATDQISLTWPASTADDLAGYRVFTGNAANFTPSTANKIFDGNALAFSYTTTTYSAQWFKIVAVDKFNQESTTATATTAAITPISPFVVDVTAPAAPAWTAGTIINQANGLASSINLAWTQTVPSPDDLAGFEIRYRRVGDTSWIGGGVFEATARAATIPLPLAYTNFEFAIRSVDKSSNYSSWTTATVNSPANAAPANISGLTSIVGRDNIRYSWTASTDADLRNYEVTVAKDAAFTVGANTLTFLTGTANYLAVGGLTPDTTYYARVRAIDVAGSNSTAWSGTDTKTTLSYNNFVGGGNKVNQSSFEGTAPQIINSGTATPGAWFYHSQGGAIAYSIDTTRAYVGTRSLKIQTDTAAGYTSIRQQVSIKPSTTYVVSTWTYLDTQPTGMGGNGALLDVWDGTSVTANSGNAVNATQVLNKWVRQVVRITTSSTSTALHVTLNAPVNAPAWFDAVQVEEGEIPTAWAVNVSEVQSTALNAETLANAAIKTYVTEYSVSASETVAPTAGWSTSTPTRTPGTFIWYRVTVTYNNNTSATTSPALLTGNAGATGATGPTGSPAPRIDLTATTQVLSSPAAGGATNPTTSVVTGTAANTTITVWDYSVDGAAFSTTVPTGVSRSANVVTITGATMTAKTITVRMSDAAGVADTMTVAKVFDGATGTAGSNGSNGTNGTNGVDAYTVLLTNEAEIFLGTVNTAQADSSVTSVLAYKGSVAQNATIGTLPTLPTGMTAAITNNGTTNATITFTVTTALTQPNGTVNIPITVAGISFSKAFSWSISFQGTTGSQGLPGNTGSTGPQGVSVTSIVPYFQSLAAGSSAPANPGTVATPPAPWVTPEPAYTAGTELWRTERIAFSDGTYSYTPVSKDSAYVAAATALTAANGKNKITHSTNPPGTTTNTPGDIWIRINDDINRQIIAQWRGIGNGSGAVGTGWESETIRDEFIANVSASKIIADSVFSNNATVKSIFTLGDSGTAGIIRSYDYPGGLTGFSLSSAGLVIRSGAVSASALTAGVLGSSTGIIDIGAGASLRVNGGSIYSNNYSGSFNPTSGAGWSLGATGLVVNNGTISANALVAGTISGTNTITLSGANAKIVGTGFELSGSGLTVTNGTIAATAITLTSAFNNAVVAGTTVIDGGKITTGTIQSSNQGATGQPYWSISLTGAASFSNLQVLGNSVLGTVTSAAGDSSQIASANYIAGTQGWKITNASGAAEFNNVTVRGSIYGNSNSTFSGGSFIGGIFSTSPDTSPRRIVMTGVSGGAFLDNDAIEFQTPYSGYNVTYGITTHGRIVPIYDTAGGKLGVQINSGFRQTGGSSAPIVNGYINVTANQTQSFVELNADTTSVRGDLSIGLGNSNSAITRAGQPYRMHQVGNLTSSYTTTTTEASLTGTQVSVTVQNLDEVYLITGTFDVNAVSASANNLFIGTLQVDGSAIAGQAIFNGVTAGMRATVSQTWRVTGLSQGTHTFRLSCRKQGANYDVLANGNTNLQIVRTAGG